MGDGVECPFTSGDCDLPAIHVPVAVNVDAAFDRSYGRLLNRTAIEVGPYSNPIAIELKVVRGSDRTPGGT
jgi:hypothetical protein